VVDDARRRLRAAGWAARADVRQDDIRNLSGRYDLVLLANNVYYFPAAERVALFKDLGRLLDDGGELLVVTMTTPGSIAAAHLHLLLVCQEGAASLPSADQLTADLRTAGLRVESVERLVPTEPMVAVRARPRR